MGERRARMRNRKQKFGKQKAEKLIHQDLDRKGNGPRECGMRKGEGKSEVRRERGFEGDERGLGFGSRRVGSEDRSRRLHWTGILSPLPRRTETPTLKIECPPFLPDHAPYREAQRCQDRRRRRTPRRPPRPPECRTYDTHGDRRSNQELSVVAFSVHRWMINAVRRKHCSQSLLLPTIRMARFCVPGGTP